MKKEKKISLELNLKDFSKINEFHPQTESTALFIGCQNRCLEIVEFLLKNGVDINKSDNYGWTPLLLARDKGYEEIVNVLLHHTS